LYAFDAAGSTNCSGTPTVCSPLWKATTTALNNGGPLPAPAVTGSFVYYPELHRLDAFDAAGSTNCSGTPTVCSPVWTADFGTASTWGWPVVGGNVVYQSILGGPSNIVAVDAAGARGCTGTPAVCAPLWSYQASGTNTATPAIGPDGMLYAGFQSIQQFSTDGTTGCGGTPAVCQPLHTASLGNGLAIVTSLADDVVLLPVWNPNAPATINAYHQGTLAPLTSFSLGSGGNQFPGFLAISNGKVFVPTSNGDLQVWKTNG
jgi:hypothetical protein